MKRCPVCATTKPLAEFNNEGRSKDGKSWRCRECACAAKREAYHRDPQRDMANNRRWRLANPEKSRVIKQRWDERNADKKRAYLDGWYHNNPIRRRAHTAVRRALRDGRIVRPSSCVRCGGTGRIEAHHPDYFKPLEVEWLCTPCHRVTPHVAPDPNDPRAAKFRKWTKLPPSQRQAVAAAVASGRSKRSVASEFGVSEATVSNIVREAIDTGRSLGAAIRAEVSLAGNGYGA